MQIKDNKIQLSKPALVAFDLDGTLTTKDFRSSWQVVHEYFGTWKTHGEAILNKFLNGEISYNEFDRADAEVWINRTEDEYQEAINSIKLRKGTRELINFFKKKECTLAILSMGLEDAAEKYAKQLEFDYWIGNQLIRCDNRITGEVVVNVGWQEKGIILKRTLEKFQIAPENCIAIGDSESDIEMFEVAKISIAIEPSSKQVAAAADFVCKTRNLDEIISFFSRE